MRKIEFIYRIGSIFFLLSAVSNVYAQEFKGPITVLVPFAAGGTVDIAARQLSKDIGGQLKRPILVDNRGGGGGTIAVAALARANPDGNTIMFDHMGITFDAALYEKLPYDSKLDIIPVAYIGATPNVLVITNSLPVNNIQEFIAYAKKRPSMVNYGSGGIGSAGHLAMETFQAATNTKLTHVPYKGSGPAITDLIGGQIQAMLMTMAAIKPYIDSGQVRALATSGAIRSPALPNLPTLKESGLKDFVYAPWYGVFAPAKTPASTLNQLHDAVNFSIQIPENREKLAQQGLELKALTRAQFQDIYNTDLEFWGSTIRKLNIKN